MKTTVKAIMGTVLSMALVIGCGSLENPDYQGESLLSLVGSVTIEQDITNPESELHVGLVWSYDHGQGDQTGFQDSIVGAQFPAQFSLELYSHPPKSLLMTFEDMTQAASPEEMEVLEQIWPRATIVGLAYIAVWEDTNANGRFDAELGLSGSGPDRILGGAPEFALGFIGGEFPPPEFFSLGLGGLINMDNATESLGYTLLKTTGNPNCFEQNGVLQCGSFEELVPVPTDTKVNLVIGQDPLSFFPNIG